MSCYSCDGKPRHWDPEGNTNLQGGSYGGDNVARYNFPWGNINLQGARGRDAFPYSNTNLQGHPNTVQASHVPLYLRGAGLGDDPPDFTDFGPTVDSPILGPVDYSLQFPASPDQVPSYSDMIANPSLIPTTPTTGTGPAMGPVPSAGGAVSSITSALANLFRPARTSPASNYGPGPSPRVTVPSSAPMMSIGTALPIIAIGAVAMIVLTGGGGRRRR